MSKVVAMISAGALRARPLSPDGNPEFATVLKVMRALGLKLKVAV
jgi:DNA-binding phage protein